MRKCLESLLIGDAMIPGNEFRTAAEKYLGDVIADARIESRVF